MFHHENSGALTLKKAIIVLFFAVIIVNITSAQRHNRLSQGSISGKILDSEMNFPIEYATILLFNQNDSTQINGTITDREGNFQLIGLRPGLYYLTVSFMGYNSKNVDEIVIQRGMNQRDLGNIPLKLNVVDMEEVEISAEKLPLEYKIDKKVVNVDKHYTAASGTAVDVLENVPSVQVDIDGNVSLRGSGNFTLLIDGRPSILDASDALQQIPASSIDNIEIITNPSAKYNPEGTSGIINIVMKRNQMNGTGGIVNLNAGLKDKYGGDFLINYKRGILKAIFGANYNRKYFPGSSKTENRTIQNGLTSYVNSNGESIRGRTFYGIRGGLEFDFNQSNWLSIGGRFGDRSMERNSDLDYDEWSEPDLQHVLYTSENNMERSGYYYMINLDYKHKFNRKNHEISSMFYFSQREMEEESTNELRDNNGDLTSGQLSTEEGPADRIGLEIDYILPIGEDSKFETGYHNRLRQSKDVTGLTEYDPGTGLYSYLPQYSHNIEYQRDTHSLYTMFSDEIGDFGYQAGLRGEYIYRLIEVTDQDNIYKLDRWDYFPTIHMSYQLNGGKQLMASYSRRIQRPRGWYLEPFETWTDAYNIRMGNPSLKPEYIDSYELGFQTNFDRNLFSIESYYRFTDNVIERIRSVYDENVTLSTIDNVGKSYAYGLETMLNMKMKKWWNFNLMIDLFNYRIEGDLYNETYSNESFDWHIRFNNTFPMTNSTTLQLNTNYHSPTVSSQGESEEFFVVNAAIKQELIRKKLTATLQVNDIFSTSKHELVNEGPDFYSYRYFDRDAPIIMLNLSLNINDYNQERKRNGEMEMEGEDEF